MNSSSESRAETVKRQVKPGASGDPLTYLEWKAIGRPVLRGRHGVKAPVIATSKKLTRRECWELLAERPAKDQERGK